MMRKLAGRAISIVWKEELLLWFYEYYDKKRKHIKEIVDDNSTLVYNDASLACTPP